MSAVNQGATSLGIKAKDGVIIATEKKLPSILVDKDTVKKIVQLTPEVRTRKEKERKMKLFQAISLSVFFI